jgi:peptidoglycan/xylan/chitin deacetylase (PgdA/CDA1 family)
MKALLKELFFRCLPYRPLPRDRAVILMYHSVDASSDAFMNVRPERFEAQMSYLRAKNVQVISLEELVCRLRAKESLGGAAVITFDDGYRDNFVAAFPILQRYRFPATIFVTTSLIGKTDEQGRGHLSSDDMKTMLESGLIDIQPHTQTHPKLSRASDAIAEAEIRGSKRDLETMLGETRRHFAYPFGDFSDTSVDIVRRCGFESAVTVKEGTVGPDADLFRVPRVSVDRSTTPAQFRGKISGAIDRYQSLKH